MRFIALISFALVFALTGCSTLPTGDEYRAQIQAKLSTVVYSDGINEKESQIIADAYLDKHMAASFGHIGPFDGGAAWVFKITGDVVPFELTNVPPVLVNKSTGVVTWEAKPPLKI
jgi:hypothetical protein